MRTWLGARSELNQCGRDPAGRAWSSSKEKRTPQMERLSLPVEDYPPLGSGQPPRALATRRKMWCHCYFKQHLLWPPDTTSCERWFQDSGVERGDRNYKRKILLECIWVKLIICVREQDLKCSPFLALKKHKNCLWPTKLISWTTDGLWSSIQKVLPGSVILLETFFPFHSAVSYKLQFSVEKTKAQWG